MATLFFTSYLLKPAASDPIFKTQNLFWSWTDFQLCHAVFSSMQRGEQARANKVLLTRHRIIGYVVDLSETLVGRWLALPQLNQSHESIHQDKNLFSHCTYVKWQLERLKAQWRQDTSTGPKIWRQGTDTDYQGSTFVISTKQTSSTLLPFLLFGSSSLMSSAPTCLTFNFQMKSYWKLLIARMVQRGRVDIKCEYWAWLYNAGDLPIQ